MYCESQLFLKKYHCHCQENQGSKDPEPDMQTVKQCIYSVSDLTQDSFGNMFHNIFSDVYLDINVTITIFISISIKYHWHQHSLKIYENKLFAKYVEFAN